MHREYAELRRPQHCTVHAAPAASSVDGPGHRFGSCNGSGGTTQYKYFPCPKTWVPVMKKSESITDVARNLKGVLSALMTSASVLCCIIIYKHEG
jgi:hypothetical protein